MGLLISRFRTKKSTIEVLEDIDKDINRLQKNRKQNQERQKKIVTSLLIYSIAAYVLSAIIFFVYYFPDTWKLRLLYSLPLLLFPLLIWGLKKLLHWYFVKRIASNDGELLKLREQKKQILEDVMETETYKKAKEILEKFDPVRFRKLEALPDTATPQSVSGTPGTAVHQRSGGIRPVAARPGLAQQPRQMASRTPISTPRMPAPQPRPMPTPTPIKTSTPYSATPNFPPRYPGVQPPSAGPRQQQPLVSATNQPLQQQQQQAMMGNTPMGPRGYAMPPGPPMPRTILPQQRGTMDRLMDYLVGDGPENRYALICQLCYSHNGMALKEEFEYLTFRCCYCYQLNPARKQRPMAPRLEFFAPRGNNFNTDSQGSAASDEDSDDEEDGDSGEDNAGNRRAPNQADKDTPARHHGPRPGFDRGRGGVARDRAVGSSVRAPSMAQAGNTSSNAVAASSAAIKPVTPARSGNPQQRPGSTQPTTAAQGLKKSSGSGVSDTGTQFNRKEPAGEKSANIRTSSVSDIQTSSKEKSDKIEQNTEIEQDKIDSVKTSDGGVVDNDGGTDFVIIPSPQADGGAETDIPYIDEDGQDLSPSPNSLNTQIKESVSSFAAATPENQTEAFTSLASESEVESSVFTSVADQVESSRGEEGVKEDSGDSLPDGGQERGPTLSEEIRDSVKSLLSPSAIAEDDRDGGSVQCSEEAVSTNVNGGQLDGSQVETPDQPPA